MGGGFEDKTSPSMLAEGRAEGNEEGLDDLATLADSYLLSEHGLANEFAAEDLALGSLSNVGEAGRGQSLDPFAWPPDLRTPSIGNWEASDIRQLIQKARVETNDSNDWEHTRDHRGSFLNTHKSDSPNSGHLSATSTPLQTLRPHAQDLRAKNIMETSNRPESPFIPRLQGKDVGQQAFESEKQHFPPSFSRLLHSRGDGVEHPAEVYERSSGPYPGVSSPACPPSVFASHHPPAQMSRAMWSNSEAQDAPSWMQMREARPRVPQFSSLAPPEGPMGLTLHDRRHSVGNVVEEAHPEHHLRGRAASSVDDAINLVVPKMECSPRMNTGAKHFISHMPPPPMYSPQQPGTPPEAFSLERKRKRPADGQLPPLNTSSGQQEGVKNGQGGGAPLSHMSSSSSQTAQDDLIRLLKGQIERIDSNTKAILKDTLYRISRNTNSENGQVSAPRPRQSSRNQYLDKLVANFLYNRFEYTDARPGLGPSAGTYVGSYGGGGYRVSSVESIKPLMP